MNRSEGNDTINTVIIIYYYCETSSVQQERLDPSRTNRETTKKNENECTQPRFIICLLRTASDCPKTNLST